MDKSWILEETKLEKEELLKNESLFHTANGYLGIRGNFEEGYQEGIKTIRGTYINGFYDIGQLKYTEKFVGFPEEYQKMVNLIDIQGIDLYIEGERFSLFEGVCFHYRRTLYMQKGIVERCIGWRSKRGHEVEIKVKRMASFAVLELFTIEYSVTSLNFTGTVEIKSSQIGTVSNFSDSNDPRLAHESTKNILIEKMQIEDELAIMIVHTGSSELTLASVVGHVVNGLEKVKYQILDDRIIGETSAVIKTGETVSIEKYAIFTDSRRYPKCEVEAFTIANKVTSLSLELWYNQQVVYLKNFWDAAYVNILGDVKMNTGIHFSMYGLLQSVGKDKFGNIAAKGLSGEGYEGHYFWDTEIYIFPFFLLTQSQLAKNLLEFRYQILEQAREQARLLGHKKGALYPWRTITGTECSSYFISGSAQYHMNGDIAYTFIQYYLATGDICFMQEKGAEVLFEIARLWLDAGHFTEESFKIDCVTGPDEYTCLVNNNYYTNAVAKYSLYWAYQFYVLLKEAGTLEAVVHKIKLEEIEVLEWRNASELMYLPVDDELRINPQDDSFLMKKPWDFQRTKEDQYPLLLHFHPLYIYRHQVLKQADTVLAHFLLEDYQSMEVVRNSFEYYEKITTHDSSLSTCIYGNVAARLFMVDKAYTYFTKTAGLDLYDTHGNTKHGIHTANMGGTYMGIVYGFGGLRIKEDGLHLNSVIPVQWEGYEFKINFQKRVLKICVMQEKLRITILSGDAMDVWIYETMYRIEKELTVLLNEIT